MTITVADILEILSEIESTDPIDWTMLAIDENMAAEFVVNNLVDQYHTTWANYNEPERSKVVLATMAKLVLENFVLNLKLYQREK